jgi:hypothetical protein
MIPHSPSAVGDILQQISNSVIIANQVSSANSNSAVTKV